MAGLTELRFLQGFLNLLQEKYKVTNVEEMREGGSLKLRITLSLPGERIAEITANVAPPS